MIKKIRRKNKKTDENLPTRITNDTVAEHREKVLAGGRKLRYPRQYTKHALVRNTIIVSLAVLVALSLLVWMQLYVRKDTSDLAYRITRVLPLPVAKIDGAYARYGDYLLYHRSTVAVLEKQNTEGATASDRMQFQQGQALDRVLEDAYAQKIAKERGITVTDEQADQLIEEKRKEAGMTESAYAVAVSDQLNWTMSELHQAMKYTLLRREVAYSVDDTATQTVEKVEKLLKSGKSLDEVAESLGKSVELQQNIVVPENNADGGLSQAAQKLKVGETSGVTKTMSGDGYYFIKRVAGTDDTIGYSYIKVPLTKFKEEFNKVKNDKNKTKLFIEIQRTTSVDDTSSAAEEKK